MVQAVSICANTAQIYLATCVCTAAALFELAKKIPATAAIDCAPTEPPSHVYLGEKYVNNQTLSDVTFLVEGQEFYAHRIALLASSDIFRSVGSMLNLDV